MKRSAIIALAKDTFNEWNEDKAPRLGAALAYYTVFSIAPLLVIVIAVVGLLFGQQSAQDQILSQVRGLVGDQGATLLQTMVESANRSKVGPIATIFGIVSLVLGALGVFGQLQDALNTIWEVTPRPGRKIVDIVKDRVFLFTLVIGTGFLLTVSLVLSAGLAAAGQFFGSLLPVPALVLEGLNLVLTIGLTTLLFALMFKYIPDARIAWHDVWIGAVLTSLLFTAGKFLIGLYLGQGSVTSVYGAAGSLAVLLLWIFYSAQILFLGAEFTQVYASRYGSGIRPDPKAIALTESERAHQGMPRTSTVKRIAAGQPFNSTVGQGQVPSSSGPLPQAPATPGSQPLPIPTAVVESPSLPSPASAYFRYISAMTGLLIGLLAGAGLRRRD